jgi:hypothetical protein
VRHRPDLLSFNTVAAQEVVLEEKEVTLSSAYDLDIRGEQSEASTTSLLAVDTRANYVTLNM